MPPEEDSKEKRRYVRVDSRLITWYRRDTQDEADFIETFGALTKNISAGGILFETDESFPIGTVLDVELRIPNLNRTVKTRVQVVRTEELGDGRYDVGVMFLDFPDAERMIVRNYVDNRTEE